MLIIRPDQRSTNAIGQHPHEAGEADEGRCRAPLSAASIARRSVSRSGKALWSMARVAIPAALAMLKSRRIGAVGENEGDLGREIRARARPRSARPCSSRGPRSGWRRGGGSSELQGAGGLHTARRPHAQSSRRCAPGSRRPSRRRSITLSALSALATTIMPMPQLKVRSISASATPPVLASQPKTGGSGDGARDRAARRRRRAGRAGCCPGSRRR